MASSLEKPGEKLNNNINVTPLADVMLVLLIIFMVVTPIITQGVEMDLPPATHHTPHPKNEKKLTLSLTESGGIYLNHDQIMRSVFVERLSSELAERTDKTLYLRAAETLDYGWVLEFMDVCRDAGARDIALLTRERVESS